MGAAKSRIGESLATDSTSTRDAAPEAAAPPLTLGMEYAGPPSPPEGLLPPERTAPEKPAPNKPGAPAKSARRPPRAQLHFVVIILLCLDVVFGLGLALFAEKVIDFEPMALLGFGLAALGLGILAYFVLIGDGRAKPRS